MSLKTFTDAYIECALWSSTDDAGSPLDDDYGPSDIAPATRKQMEKDCAEFYRADGVYWADSGWSDAQAGHDFWLSRNGHGAGFFDRTGPAFFDRKGGSRSPSDSLQAHAKACGSFDLYVGDDGKVHGS